MKTRILVSLLAMFYVSFGFAQKMKISGKVSGEVKQVVLKAFDEKELGYQQIDLQDIKNGAYSFSFKFNQPNLYLVEFDGEKSARLSVSVSSDIKVNYQSGKVEILDSPESLSMIEFDKQNGALQGKHFGQLKKDADKAMAAGDKEALAEIQARSATAIQAFLKEFRVLIVEMGETPAGYFAIQSSDFNKEIDFISQRLEAFESRIPESQVTKALARQVYRSKVVAIGKTPPAIAARDSKGEDFNLGQYQGKVVLIDFWAAWCRACRIENPQFVELYGEYQSKGLEIVSISQDKKKKTWQEAIAKDGIGIWRQVQDSDGSISELFSISSLPQNLVLGRDGKVIGKNMTAESLKKLLSTHL
ncbi:MAG: redoxin domain-containing protein [Roseivirga sp.]|nr:redoxin domain-containing protein [Roseivirga sp.]